MLLQFKKLRFLAVALTAVGTAAACDDGLSPEERVAGPYEVSVLSVTEGGITFDAIDLGAELEIFLHEDGTTTGYFFVPAQPGDPDSGIDADLTGTWTLRDEVVTFNHSGDTLLRNMEFQVEGNTLVGTGTFTGGFTVHVVLSKQ